MKASKILSFINSIKMSVAIGLNSLLDIISAIIS